MLESDSRVILARTCGQTHRPLLNVENPQERIDLLLKMRAPYYAQADVAIDTSKLPLEKVVEGIEKAIKSPKAKTPRKSSPRKKKR